MLRRLMEYAGDFGLSTGEFCKRFLGVFNLARSQTRETDTLLRIGFRGASPGKSKQDERSEELKNYVQELERLITVSRIVIPERAEIARLELKKDGEKKKREEREDEWMNTLKDIFNHMEM